MTLLWHTPHPRNSESLDANTLAAGIPDPGNSNGSENQHNLGLTVMSDSCCPGLWLLGPLASCCSCETGVLWFGDVLGILTTQNFSSSLYEAIPPNSNHQLYLLHLQVTQFSQRNDKFDDFLLGHNVEHNRSHIEQSLVLDQSIGLHCSTCFHMPQDAWNQKFPVENRHSTLSFFSKWRIQCQRYVCLKRDWNNFPKVWRVKALHL